MRISVFGLDLIISKGHKSVGILGFSFKALTNVGARTASAGRISIA